MIRWWIVGIIILIWVVCGIIVYGKCFAYSQRRWPSQAKRDYKDDMFDSLLCGICGPIGLFFVLDNYYESDVDYGLKFW